MRESNWVIKFSHWKIIRYLANDFNERLTAITITSVPPSLMQKSKVLHQLENDPITGASVMHNSNA